MSFLGPKPTQDPMNNVFEQKKIIGGKFFSGPQGPPTEKIFGPGPGRPGRAGGGPKGGQSRSVGVSNPSKTIKTPHGTCERWGRPARNSSSSQSYDQNTFFGLPWGFWPVLGASRPHGPHGFFGPINRDSFGPNGRFPGAFWPKLSLLGCLRSLEKKLGQNSLYKFFFEFSNFGGFCGF